MLIILLSFLLNYAYSYDYETINKFVIYSQNAELNKAGPYHCEFTYEPIVSDILENKLKGYGKTKTTAQDQLIISCIKSSCHNIEKLVYDVGLPILTSMTADEKKQFFEAHQYSQKDMEKFNHNSNKKPLLPRCTESSFNTKLIIYSLCTTGITSCR